jgi:hypothetical protein
MRKAFCDPLVVTVQEEDTMLLWILLIVLVVFVIAAWPTWGYSSGWGFGYYPSGLFAVLAAVLLVILLLQLV